MQVLSNEFKIDWSTVNSDYYLLFNKEEILNIINNNPDYLDRVVNELKDFLKREDHMRTATTAF